MKTPDGSRLRRRTTSRQDRRSGPVFTIWRVLAVIALTGSFMNALVVLPFAPVAASGQDCSNGQVWDDTQQMCVDPTSEGGDQGQGQPVEGDTSGDQPTATETPTVTPTATVSGSTLVVSVFTCPTGYDGTAPNAIPANDCLTPADGVSLAFRAGDQPPVQQPVSGGTTTFVNPMPGPFTLDATMPMGSTAIAWTCQGALSQPTTGTGTSIAGQIVDGDQLTCSIFLVVAPTTVTPTVTITATATTAPGFASTAGSPAPSLNGPTLNGPGKGAIRITLSMCPIGFDPAPGEDVSNVCQKTYLFTGYPITFTAINTDSDVSTTGENNTFLGWVSFDDLEPGPYQVQAPIAAGLARFIDKYGTCGEPISLSGGTVAFTMNVVGGSYVSCDLAVVIDANVPTPTRAPNTNSSSFSLVAALCPPGFVAGSTTVDPTRACTGTQAGLRFNVSGPVGSPNPVRVGGTDTLSLSAVEGTYHVSLSIPEGIASIAGVSCGGYDVQEQHYIDDFLVTPTISGTDIAFDAKVPGAFFFTCTVYAVPNGPSPTPTATVTLTPTITPTPTMTVVPAAQSQSSGQSSSGSATTSSQSSSSQSGAQGGPDANTGSGASSQSAQQGGPDASASSGTTTTAQGAQQGGPDSESGAASSFPTQPAGQLSMVIESYLCPAGFTVPPPGLAPDGCFDAYPGAIFSAQGLKTGIILQATAGDILPDAAYFANLPADEYVVTQLAAPGIVESFGYCSLLGGDAQGFPVTPPVMDGMLQHAFDSAARTFTCHWYAVPDATFGGVPNPVAPVGISLTIHAFTCPAGYDPSSADANPTLDCAAPATGIPFTASGQASGTSTQLTTGVGTATNPLDGQSRSGTVTFTGLQADTYVITQGSQDDSVNAFVSSCSLATATDPAVPIYPTVTNGTIQYQVNDNESLTCLWYTIPRSPAGISMPAGSVVGVTGAGDRRQE
ncbi:MAG: hypothetical protein QM753_10785 [Thermomicrobiales bacterium]